MSLEQFGTKTKIGVGLSFLTVGGLVLGSIVAVESIPADVRLGAFLVASTGLAALGKKLWNRYMGGGEKAGEPKP